MFARAPLTIRDLNVGHCFETLVVGHVLGIAMNKCYVVVSVVCVISLEQLTAMVLSLPSAAQLHNDSENTTLAPSCAVLEVKMTSQRLICALVRNHC